ncbi:MAG: HAD family phosphatase, partial [Muribaculaceae bacterium]|nr:HAD family phosphatase [Muribaculaceae bacterium]
KNLLFDLGGVIMDIKRERCVAAFERLGMVNADSFLGEYSQKGPFLKLEEGAITPSEFREEVRKLIARNVTDKEIDIAFCEFLIGIPIHRLETLRQLRKSYNVYLLSNTNPIMWGSRIAEEFRQEGLEIKDYFDGIVTSFEAKSIKPDRRIFEMVIEECGIRPDETIFLDDSQKNLDAATHLGFGTILVSPGAEFMDLLK